MAPQRQEVVLALQRGMYPLSLLLMWQVLLNLCHILAAGNSRNAPRSCFWGMGQISDLCSNIGPRNVVAIASA
jgi:hypothetical protein